jgi:hypothetical protein
MVKEGKGSIYTVLREP